MPTLLWMPGGVAPFAHHSVRHWVQWATFRYLESRMGKSGYVKYESEKSKNVL